MVDATYIDNDRLQVVQNSDISFDTDRPSITLFPDSARIVQTRTITFPSPIQARAYYRNVSGGTVCELWSTLIWQEWGPDEGYSNELYFPVSGVWAVPGPTTRNLPQEYIGDVPAAANYLDIRVRLTRTTTPPAFMGIEPPIMFPPNGEWVTLPGGSCPTEYFHPLIRHFDIVRSGNSMYLRRFQSTFNSGSNLAPGGHAQAAISTNQSGWNSFNQRLHGVSTYSDGTSPDVLAPYSNTELAILINKRGPANDGNTRRPGGSDACNGSWPDLTSAYSADIIITPGLYTPAS